MDQYLIPGDPLAVFEMLEFLRGVARVNLVFCTHFHLDIICQIVVTHKMFEDKKALAKWV